MDEEYADTNPNPMHLELCSDDVFLLPLRRPAVKDLTGSIAGSFVVHMLLALTVLFLPFVQPPRNVQSRYLTVSLVDNLEGGGNKGNAGEIGTACGACAGPHIPEPSTSVENTKEHEAIDLPNTLGKPDRAGSDKENSTNSIIHRNTTRSPIAKQASAVPRKAPSTSVKAGRKTGNEIPEGKAHQVDNVAGTGEGGGNSTSGGQPSEASSHRPEDRAPAVDKAPEPLRKYEPIYPDKARRLGISGRVVVKFVVEPDGHVSRPRILESYPEGIFEQSALDAIVRWRFTPGYSHGKPVATWVVLPFKFELT